MPFAKVQTRLRLEEGLYEKLKAIASIEGRSLNNLYVTDYEVKNGPLPPPSD